MEQKEAGSSQTLCKCSFREKKYVIWVTNETTFMAESEEEVKSLLMEVKEESEKLA